MQGGTSFGKGRARSIQQGQLSGRILGGEVVKEK